MASGPGAAGLPNGLRPPGAPEAIFGDDTDVLIASAVASLTRPMLDDDPPEPSMDHGSGVASRQVIRSHASSPAVPEPRPSQQRARPSPMVMMALLVGLSVAATGVGLAVGWMQTPQAPAMRPVLSASLDPDLPRMHEHVVAPRQQTMPTSSAASSSPPPLEVIEGHVGANDETAVAETTPTLDTRPRTHRKRSIATPPEDEKHHSIPTPSREDLLVQARNALASGNAGRAFALAASSRRAGMGSAALIVMAKAACQLGNTEQARSAFARLRLKDRRGIRAECRTHGVRLGV